MIKTKGLGTKELNDLLKISKDRSGERSDLKMKLLKQEQKKKQMV